MPEELTAPVGANHIMPAPSPWSCEANITRFAANIRQLFIGPTRAKMTWVYYHLGHDPMSQLRVGTDHGPRGA